MSEDALLLLDAELCLSRFTAQATSLLGLSDGDLGVPIARLSSRFGGADLERDARRVLAGEERAEGEAQSENGQRIRFSYRPYRSPGTDSVAGVVVVLTEVRGVRPTDKRGQAPAQPREPGAVPTPQPHVRLGEDAGDRSLAPTLAPPFDPEPQRRRADGEGATARLDGFAETAAYVAALERRLEEQAGEIRRLGNELLLAEQNERARIARLLHDEFQQLLYALKIRIDAVLGGATLAVHGGAIRELVEQMSALASTLVVSLAPPIYESDDFKASLAWLADYVGDRYGVQVDVSHDGSIPLADEGRRVLLFEAVRELLFNVVKHAGTNRARVRVHREAEYVVAVVEDEGTGFDVAAAMGRRPGNNHCEDGDAERGGGGGFGLPHITRRLRLLGGRLEIESVPGAGTRASAAVPL